jgi:hypothetical protein
MGKGLPGGRRQAGRIDYRTEPCDAALSSQIDHGAQAAAGGIAPAARHLSLAWPCLEAGRRCYDDGGRVGQGAIAVGASYRGDGGRRAGERAFCWLTAWLAVNQSRPRRLPGIEHPRAPAAGATEDDDGTASPASAAVSELPEWEVMSSRGAGAAL